MLLHPLPVLAALTEAVVDRAVGVGVVEGGDADSLAVQLTFMMAWGATPCSGAVQQHLLRLQRRRVVIDDGICKRQLQPRYPMWLVDPLAMLSLAMQRSLLRVCQNLCDKELSSVLYVLIECDGTPHCGPVQLALRLFI